MKNLRKDDAGVWLPFQDPRVFIIGIVVILAAIIALYLSGMLAVALAGMIIFAGILCVVQIVPQLRGIPGLVVGSVLVVIGLALLFLI